MVDERKHPTQMIAEPKIIKGPENLNLREQTLAEYCALVSGDHLINVELRELQRRAVRLVEVEKALQEAAADNAALEAKLLASTQDQTGPGPEPVIPIPETVTEPAVTEGCPICMKTISARKGPWLSHMKTKHSGVVPVPVPKTVDWSKV